jgi:hypothetical protein
MKATILIAGGALTVLALSPTANADNQADTTYLSHVQAIGVNGPQDNLIRAGHSVCDNASQGASRSVMSNALLTGSRNVNGANAAITDSQAAGMVAFAIDDLCPGVENRPAQAAPQEVPQPAASAPQPAASVPQPVAASSKMDRAIAWANDQVGTDLFGPHGCGRFVATAYGAGGLGVDTAKQFYDQLDGEGKIHRDLPAPNGALVFSQSSWDIDPDTGIHWGHVDLARSDGKFVSGGVDPSIAGEGNTVAVLSSPNPSPGSEFLGWAYPPDNWPGR